MHMEGIHDGSASSNSDGPMDAPRGLPLLAVCEPLFRFILFLLFHI